MSEDTDKISRRIYLHSPINPPSTGHGLNVNFNLKNSNYVTMNDWENSLQPSFTLTVKDPKSIGLIDFQGNNVEDFVNEMILSSNLIMTKAAFSRHNSDSTKTEISRKKPEAPKPTVEDTPTGKKISITEVVTITDSVHITVGFNEELNETELINLLSKIHHLKRDTIQTNLKLNDLAKSLNEYAAAMSSFERLSIFKNLFSALELAINCDGIDRSSSDLDNEIHRITGVSLSRIEDCRRFNARTKHVDRSPQDEQEYKEGLNKLGEKIIYLREAAQKAIIFRLGSI